MSGVINYCMPLTVDHYVHRIGRTARAENLGTALSFVVPGNEADRAILTEVQKRNPPRDGHPVPQCLPFDIKEIESFTYRWARRRCVRRRQAASRGRRLHRPQGHHGARGRRRGE